MLAVVLTSVAVGMYRGFFRELLSLLAWLASLWVSWSYHLQLSALVASYLPPSLVVPASMSALLFVSLAACTLVARVVETLLGLAGTAIINRPLGVAFGLTRGGVILVVVTSIFFSSPMKHFPWFQQSLTYQFCHQYSLLETLPIPDLIAL